MLQIELRAMQPSDVPAARQLWADAEGVEVAEGDSVDELTRYLRRNPELSTVAYEQGRLVGAVLCGHDGRRGFIYHLAVAPDRRGAGIGRAVMERSLAGLKKEGIVRALLLVAAENGSGERFWLKEGWERMEFAHPMGIDL